MALESALNLAKVSKRGLESAIAAAQEIKAAEAADVARGKAESGKAEDAAPVVAREQEEQDKQESIKQSTKQDLMDKRKSIMLQSQMSTLHLLLMQMALMHTPKTTRLDGSCRLGLCLFS